MPRSHNTESTVEWTRARACATLVGIHHQGHAYDKVVSSFESLRKLYSSGGFLDFFCIPDTEPSSNGTMTLNVTVGEGGKI